MDAQSLVVALVVVACAGYAGWTLMPSVARRALAGWVLKLPLPDRMARPLRKALAPSTGCGGCDSCGETDVETSKVKPVTFHRRAHR